MYQRGDIAKLIFVEIVNLYNIRSAKHFNRKTNNVTYFEEDIYM